MNRSNSLFDDDGYQSTIEIASTFLSKIDTRSHDVACELDTHRLLQELLPRSFPWNKPTIPLLRTLPRDIDDMKAIWCASNNCNPEPFGHKLGMFGFGAYDQGHTRCKNNDNGVVDIIFEAKAACLYDITKGDVTIGLCDNVCAAARRSKDPGVIELMVALLPPSSLNAVLASPQDIDIISIDPWLRYDQESVRKVKSLVEAERSECSSRMPLHWRLDGHIFNPPTFLENYSFAFKRTFNSDEDEEYFYKFVKAHKQQKEDSNNLYRSCSRRWFISFKVGGVSSRSSLFYSPSNSCPSKKLKVLLSDATLPTIIQSGKQVSLETAEVLDKDGLASVLGSYDCRSSSTNSCINSQLADIMPTKKTYESSKSIKRVHVGRTRLIWSNIVFNNKTSSYTSVLTKQKFESNSYKRPRSIQIAVRLNGKRLMDPSDESDKSRKKLKIKSGEAKVMCNRKDGVIMRSIDDALSKPEMLKTFTKKNRLLCTLDSVGYRKVLFNRYTSFAEPPTKKRLVSTEVINRLECDVVQVPVVERSLYQTHPKITCLPLDDGFFRVFCDVPGSMQRSPVHILLNSAAKRGGTDKRKYLCSVCWTGSDIFPVIQCCDCGLLVHRRCIKDNGEDLPNNTWKCPLCVCNAYSQQKASASDANIPARKSQRSTRLPARFSEDTTISNLKSSCKIEPETQLYGPKCNLCPHYGGAMSINGIDNKVWTHEICRIWSRGNAENKSSSSFEAYRESVCALCGMGQIIDADDNFGTISKKGEDVVDNNKKRVPGLVKCAAAGCSVTVHPMCAVLTTKSRYVNLEKEDTTIRESKLQDKDFSEQYILDFLRMSRVEGSCSTILGKPKTCIVPVIFCGVHNPKRDSSCYGYPAIEPLSQFMTVPSKDQMIGLHS